METLQRSCKAGWKRADAYCTKAGRKRTTCGYSINAIVASKYAGRNQTTPLKTVPRAISLSMPATTYALIPTGGVMAPMVVTTVKVTPNQTGSYPIRVTTGKKIGIETSKNPQGVHHRACNTVNQQNTNHDDPGLHRQGRHEVGYLKGETADGEKSAEDDRAGNNYDDHARHLQGIDERGHKSLPGQLSTNKPEYQSEEGSCCPRLSRRIRAGVKTGHNQREEHDHLECAGN